MRPADARFDLRLDSRDNRTWSGLGWSLFAHTWIIILVLLARSAKSPDDQAAPANPAAHPPEVSMIYLPPAPAPKSQPRPEPEPQQDPPPNRPISPDAVHADNAEPSTRKPRDEDALPAPQVAEGDPSAMTRGDRQGSDATPPAPDTSAFSDVPHRSVPLPTAGSMARLGWAPSDRQWTDEDAPEKVTCTPKPRDPGAPVETAEVDGRVFTPDNRPLPGAFLQIVGTQYTAFSDATGRYKLVFDASLVQECRTQFVRVVAPGFRGRNLILGVGPGDNDVRLARF